MLREAIARLAASSAPILARSRVYETAPVGGPPQPAFLNAAVLVAWEMAPRDLLVVTQAIERELGRTRDVRWGPRTIDLDLLWIEGVTVDEPDLVVPHPRLAERAFAVAPLLDVAPGAIEPRSGLPYRIPGPTDAVRVSALSL